MPFYRRNQIITSLGFEGVDASKYYANILEEKVIVDYAYVLSKTALKDYLETYVPLDDGYAYYIDAECTILLDSTVEIDGAITIYVGLAQA